MVKKKFVGSWLILILLIIFCWPAALIYFFIKYEEDVSSETRTCMNCGANINVYYSTCPYCGKPPVQYQPANQAPAPVPQHSDVQVSFCKNCGSKISPEQDFCISCGTKLK